MDRIPVSRPNFSGREREYLLDAFDSTWISSRGVYLEKLEAALENFVGSPSALVSNGTVGLHLLLLSNGIGPGDEVIISNLTYVATMNAVLYCGATPRFADVESESWNIDPHSAEKLLNSRTKAIIVTHLYGQPVNIEGFRSLHSKYGVLIFEDAAEAIGALYENKPVGGIFDGGIFSFFGNKTISTGEGGLVISTTPEKNELVKILRNQGNHPLEKFNHTHLGFNYRMTNLQAAIGLGQFESLEQNLKSRQEIFKFYSLELSESPFRTQTQLPLEATHGSWMFGLTFPEKVQYQNMAKFFEEQQIEIRLFFVLMTDLQYVKNSFGDETPVARRVASQGVCLPTFVGITRNQISKVVDTLKDFISSR
jgi:perosamine synthetase